MPTNAAAWLVNKGRPLKVDSAPYTSPHAEEIVVRNHAVAVNPFDWIMQCAPGMVCPWLKLPSILGSDIAGEVVAVGSAVTRFHVGDRVLAHATGTDKSRNSVFEGGFQHYTAVLAHMASPIPAGVSFEEASVLPLGLSTAACGLFAKDQLGLQPPRKNPAPTGKTLLVWGGSTSVGSNAIQLAVAAGYEVVTTASPENFAYVSELGAAAAYNYRDPEVTANLLKALRGKELAGAIAIGVGSAAACLRVMHASGSKKHVVIATFPLQFDRIAGGAGLVGDLVRQTPALVRFGIDLFRARLRRIPTSTVQAATVMHNGVGRLIYEDFLPEALAEGRFCPAPPPLMAGRGLPFIQTALEMQRRGVSAAKVVVAL